MPVATRLTAANCARASATPITMIVTDTSRRARRSRVSAVADSSRPVTVAARFTALRLIAWSTSLARITATITVATAVI